MQLHRRQFVIGKSSFNARDDWQSYKLTENYWLSYCPDLRISRATDRNEVEWCLLGMAIETEVNSTPEILIPQRSTEEVIAGYSAWAGRWLLIGQKEIHLDANGLLGRNFERNLVI